MKKTMRIRFGHAVKTLRESHNQRQDEFGKAHGFPRWVIQGMENIATEGAQEPGVEHYLALIQKCPELIKGLDKDPPAPKAEKSQTLDDVNAQILARLDVVVTNLDYLGERVAKLESARGAA